MAMDFTSDKKLEELKIEILTTFEELSNYLSVHKQKLLSRLIRIKEGYDKNIEINDAIEQLKIAKENFLKEMKSNLLGAMGEDFDNRLKKMEESKIVLDLVSFRCYSQKIRKSIDEIDLIEQIPEYVGKEHPILSKCKAGNGNGEFHNPRGVAFDKIQNKLYICDLTNHRIQVFNTNGEFLHSFGNNQLKRPHGICLSKDFVFVSDEAKKCVTKFTHEGKLSNTFDGAAKFGRNLGIDCYGEFVYICDSTFQKIHVIDLNLRYITHFGSGNVKFPGDISIHSDRIYILSLSVSSIYSFNKDYTFLKEIELSGGEKPMTVAMFMVIDPKGNFLISDGSNQEVRIFSPQGMLKHIIGRGHFNILNGLTLDNSNNIICLNHGTGRDCFQKY
eukprot:TRINITY_DN678_c0_g1_i12.p1 TRINITY_DN678_c0_g1~~TRINITY_DN678_c0_g1_i12.p1  ORF type:complete len:388 (+),score=63.14 TRINITY_DN678_c0_g1_i12:52-1215(+)